MTKITIVVDEKYPTYFWFDHKPDEDVASWRHPIDVPEETLDRWRKAEKDYDAYQREVADMIT